MQDCNGKAFKAGDIIRSQFGHIYEIEWLDSYAVRDGVYCCPHKYWPKCAIIGNAKDNPEMSVAGRARLYD